MSTDTLEELRAQIDVIDAQILDLFAKRTSLAAQIGDKMIVTRIRDRKRVTIILL